MVLAALAAEGKSTIHNIGQIERGYERIDARLRALGAQTRACRRLTKCVAPGDLPLWEVPGWQRTIRGRRRDHRPGRRPRRAVRSRALGRQPGARDDARWRAFRPAFPEFPGMVMAHQVHGQRVLWHQGRPRAGPSATAADGTPPRPGASCCSSPWPTAFRSISWRRAQVRWPCFMRGGAGPAAGILAAGGGDPRRKAGILPAELVMHLGVAICGERYEVGEEVVRGLGETVVGRGPWHVDLRQVLTRQGAAGSGRNGQSSHCTASARAGVLLPSGLGWGVTAGWWPTSAFPAPPRPPRMADPMIDHRTPLRQLPASSPGEV